MDNRFSNLTPAALSSHEKKSLITLAMKVLSSRHRKGASFNSPGDTQSYLRLRLAEYPHEVFGCLFLDTQHRIIAVKELFQGTINASAVYPRVVVKQALDLNAAATIFFHNHPSGICEPSFADKAITERLIDALALIEVQVLDHFVVSAGESVSFAQQGLI